MTLGAGIKKIVQSQGGAIQTFDFYDLAAGRGVVTLYAGDLGTSGALIYKMSNIKWYSNNGSTSTDTGEYININFEMPLNRSMIIQGNTIVNVPTMQMNFTGGVVLAKSFVVASLYASGATMDFIASGASLYIRNNLNAGDATYHLHAVSIDVPKTQIKKGETFILNISTSGAYRQVLGHDPYGRTTPAEVNDGGGTTHWGTTTALTCNVPVFIDES